MEIREIVEKIGAEKILKLQKELNKKNLEIDNLKRSVFNLTHEIKQTNKYNKEKIRNESKKEKSELRKKIRELEEELEAEKKYNRELYLTCDELYTKMGLRHSVGQLFIY